MIKVNTNWVRRKLNYSFRYYVVSNDAMERDEAYTWCEKEGLGLAMWNSAELYEDIQHITSSHDEDFYTALNNDNWVSCNTKTQHNDCDDKLMWKQRRNGHSCYFQAYPGFTKYG